MLDPYDGEDARITLEQLENAITIKLSLHDNNTNVHNRKPGNYVHMPPATFGNEAYATLPYISLPYI